MTDAFRNTQLIVHHDANCLADKFSPSIRNITGDSSSSLLFLKYTYRHQGVSQRQRRVPKAVCALLPKRCTSVHYNNVVLREKSQACFRLRAAVHVVTMLRILAGVLCLLLVHAAEEEVTEARLLVQKRILNKFLVEGKDIIVDYNIYNVGGSAALDIKLSDNSFNPAYFEVTSGLLSFKLNRLAPGSNVTHTVVIRPLTFGYFNFTSADVSYRTSEDSQELQFAHTAEPGQGGIMPVRDFDRKFSPHVTDWLAFAIMTLPSLGIPFVLWFNSKSKYENIVKQFKKH
ncbi:hypothetical protein MTO96_004289 [Rhipicephalus appendiculatus]